MAVPETDTNTALAAIAATQQAKVVPLDTSLGLLAADIAREHRLAMSACDHLRYGAAVIRPRW